MNQENEPAAADAVGTRWPELIVALLILGMSILVIADSIRVGTGWADDGPRSGYFPFYIGLAMLGSSLWILVGALRQWSRFELFAERAQLASVWIILWPMVVYVALIKFIGIYVASVILIGYFMLRHGKHRPWLTALVAVGVPGFFFVVFERWFLVPLPKGPIEAALGF